MHTTTRAHQETCRLKRALEEEEFTRSSLQRKLTALEDELSAKQTEVRAAGPAPPPCSTRC